MRRINVMSCHVAFVIFLIAPSLVLFVVAYDVELDVQTVQHHGHGERLVSQMSVDVQLTASKIRCCEVK